MQYEKLTDEKLKEIADALAAPMQYQWSKGQGGKFYPYVDARQVGDRLNEVLGINGWSSYMKVINEFSVLCELTLNFGDISVTRSDVGYSNNPLNPATILGMGDMDDDAKRKLEPEPLKAAASDALKRAAVHFGIGAFLYNFQPQNSKPADGVVIPLRNPKPEPVKPPTLLEQLWAKLQEAGVDGKTANQMAKDTYKVAFNKLSDDQAEDWLSKLKG